MHCPELLRTGEEGEKEKASSEYVALLLDRPSGFHVEASGVQGIVEWNDCKLIICP